MTRIFTVPISSVLRIGVIITASAAFATISLADDTLGGGRAAGMAGAGLALPFDVTQNHRMNFAMLAYSHGKFGIAFPEIGYHLDGITVSDLQNKFGNLGQGGISSSNITSLLTTFGSSEKTIGLDADLGLIGGGFSLDEGGSANITTIPNAALMSDPSAPPAGSQLDAYGFSYYQTEIGYGSFVPIGGNGHLAVGGAVKEITALYSHVYADETDVTAGDNGTLGPEMNGANYLKKTGTGADLGLLYTASKTSNVYYGATVENLIDPNISFTEVLPGTPRGTTSPPTTSVDPFGRRLNLGVGGVIVKKFMLAGDWYDFGNAVGESQLRLGLEYNAGGGLAVRGGYNTKTGFTVGFEVLGINFAYASNNAFTMVAGVKF